MTLEYEQLLEDMEKERQHTRLTPHFTLAEMTRTSVRGADNTPSEEAVENLRRLCGWLEKLREEWNVRYGEGNDPIIVSSGYRSKVVNRAVGAPQRATTSRDAQPTFGLAALNRRCATLPSCWTSATTARRRSTSCCWSARAAPTGCTSR